MNAIFQIPDRILIYKYAKSTYSHVKSKLQNV